MIKKNRSVPIKIQKLNALLRRLPFNHPKKSRLQEELAKSMAGYNGEKSIDFHLSFLDPRAFIILHDIRMDDGDGRYFQIDTLIFSTKFALLLEVKNISGTLIFDRTYNQLLRIINDKEEGFPDPILQVTRQKKQLGEWWVKQKLPLPPISSLIVISNPSTIIKSAPSNQVIHAASLPYHISKLTQQFKEEILTQKEMKKLSSLILKQHVSLDQDLLNQYDILKEDILTGVHCPSCYHIPMQRQRGTWFCHACQSNSIDAHKLALIDYKLLIGDTISNNQFRHFCHISSKSIASKLLAALELEPIGNRKGRKYKL
ncbi:nuclease-related domain-containing protein [Alkalihalobacterium elongatum]|uniref:nuclease-related domain-containing protein n=1 Tax=Alkalihalobacterium elongatum TaxID=2675466 RepID=UPI001C20155A|nr:nuclease-related domain-containing protein [Alkalihalobacterium elongatum]